jgi:hypothetical protein
LCASSVANGKLLDIQAPLPLEIDVQVGVTGRYEQQKSHPPHTPLAPPGLAMIMMIMCTCYN